MPVAGRQVCCSRGIQRGRMIGQDILCAELSLPAITCFEKHAKPWFGCAADVADI